MTGPLTAGEPLAPSNKRPPNAGPRGPERDKRPARRRPLVVRMLRGLFGAMLGIVLLVGVVGAAGGWMAWQHFSAGLPDVDGLRNYQPPVMSRVYAGDARLLAELATERRIFVPFSAIPDVVRRAFVSAEDQNFWTHRGVDPVAIARAAATDLMHIGQGRRPIGASTITQQVAKNMLLDNAPTLSRKAKEAILAMRIEQTLTKERILELYLNEIYLGLGSYGVAAAAQAYFNKPLDQLTVAEAAFLAALPKAPNNYNPFKYPDAARARRDWVIDRMADDRVITAQQATQAKAEPIVPSEFRRPPPIPGAEWFTEEVRRQLVAQFGQDATTQGGLMVRTSLDPVLQTAAEKSLRDGLMAYDRKQGGWRGPVTHLDAGAALDRDWQTALAQVARPPGMLPAWRLAVVLGATDQEARIGWIAADNQQPRTGTLLLSDLSWARPVRDGRLGPTPRRVTDVMKPGDVVMIEPPAQAAVQTAAAQTPAATPTRGARPAAPPPAARPVLRQIPTVQGALVSLDPSTGRVFAMVGGWSFEQSQFNRATQAQRQPGSSFKPMVYLTALEKGISPSQRFLDAPIVVDTSEGRWRPGNYEGTFNGPVPLRIALEQSLNLVTLRVAQQVGMDAVADTAIAFHMADSMPRVLPAALGAVVTTVMREAGAYASLATDGREVIPTLIDSVQDPDGHVVWRAGGLTCDACERTDTPPEVQDGRKQIADPASVFQLVTMMQGVTTRGTGVNAARGLNRPIAGKTGTSQDFTDAWFAGFTPDLVTVVWVGYDNPSSLGNGETGGNLAGPIWHDYMAEALKNRPVLSFPVPPGVTLAQWDSGSGTVTDAFKPDQQPGASGPVFGGFVAAPTGTDTSGAPPAPGSVHGGVDSSLGGLY
ncbi:MAG: penicillin-binding protein 1A [Rhodospirillales bacterium]|nr:penicillin-binding protein 1A [Rhodospirillales bacterium]